MIKVLNWHVSNDTTFEDDALKILERQHDGIEVVGSVINEEISNFDKKVDVILAVGAKQIGMSKVTQDAKQFTLPEEKLLGDWIVCIPGFTLDKYRKLQRSRLSIFTMNCFGGLMSNILGLPFRSPFVNMFLKEQDYLRFLSEPRTYMEKNLVLKEMTWNSVHKFNYPLVKLGDAEIYMNHYRDFDEAVKSWERRKTRINWYNLFVTAYTENKNFLEQFDALPYGKKVCFVSFNSDLDSAWYINPKIIKDLPFWDIVNHFSFGKPFYYDPFDMLLYGKKTPLIDM